MNGEAELSAWLPFTGLIAGEAVVMVAAAVLLQCRTRSAAWKRTIWQSCASGLLALVLFELSGAGGRLAAGLAWLNKVQPSGGPDRPKPGLQTPDPASPAVEFLQAAALSPETEVLPSTLEGSSALLTGSGRRPSVRLIAWCLVGWGVFSILLVVRACLLRLALLFWRRSSVVDGDSERRLSYLADRLGIERKIRLIRSDRLTTPAAFGLVRPTIGLPTDFAKRFNRVQQEAMLAHELAHLVARDPFWHLLADLAVAVLWWHPLAWWMRRRLHEASELAADEASLLVANGPEVLAECLVEVGRRLSATPRGATTGIDSFRSGLGRRVERLLTLRDSRWRPQDHIRTLFAPALFTVVVIPVVVVGAAWAAPASINQRASVVTLKSAWTESLGSLGSLAFLSANDHPAGAAPAEDGAAKNNPDALEAPLRWEKWDELAVLDARRDGRPVVVNFTAEWCLNSQVNERTISENAAVRKRVTDLGAVLLRADYTSVDEQVGAELKRFGRASVPLTVVYPADLSAEPIVLPELLSADALLEALDRVETNRPAQVRDSESESVNAEAFQETGPILGGLRRLERETGTGGTQTTNARPTGLSAQPTQISTERKNAPILGDLPLLGRLFESETKTGRNETTNSQAQIGESQARAGGADTLPHGGKHPNELRKRDELEASFKEAVKQLRRRAIHDKLQRIILREVQFDGVPLPEVIRYLAGEASRFDLYGGEINFMLNPNGPVAASSSSTFDPTTGTVLPTPRPEPLDWNSVIIRITPALKNVRLDEVLDAIIKVADKPIKYSVEDYAVVFSPRQPEAQLETRIFRVNPNTFVEAVQGLGTLRPLDGLILGATGGGIGDTGRPGGVFDIPRVYLPGSSQSIQNKLHDKVRAFFTAAGVNVLPPNMLFFKDRTGVLMFRGTAQELDIVQKIVETLNVAPPQVVIVVKFVEVAQDESKALGFDWFLGNVLLGRSSMESLRINLSGVLTEAQMGAVDRALEQRGPKSLAVRKVTTLSGRPTKVHMNDDLELNIVPVVAADGYSIDVKVDTALSDAGAANETLASEARRISTSVTVWDGQTAILGGLIRASEQKNGGYSMVSFFVTATIIDPAGNRVHTPDKLPFDPNKVPTQTGNRKK